MEVFLSISYKYDKAIDFRTKEALWQETKGIYPKRFYGGIVAGMLFIPYTLYQREAHYSTQPIYLHLILSIALIIFCIYKLTEYQSEKRDFFREQSIRADKMTHSNGDIRIEFSDKGFFYSDSFIEVLTNWSQYSSYYVTEGYIFLVPSKGGRIAISEENLGDENFRKSCELLITYLGNVRPSKKNKSRKRRDDILDD